MGEDLQLSSLDKFLQHALILAEEVKLVLLSECTEATYSLKPWRVETIVTKEMTANDCVCPKVRKFRMHFASVSNCFVVTSLVID